MINIKILEEHIKNKNFKLLYLFYGEEKFLKNYYINKIKKSILEDKDLMNLSIFEDKNINIENIKNSYYTLPFMNNYRLIIIKNSELFISGQKENTEKLFNILEQLNLNTIVIFLEENIDKRNKLFKLINKVGYTVNFTILKENDLLKWIVNICKKENINISNKTAKKFINTVSLNMYTIKLELDKLINYKSKEKEILEEDIELIITKSIDTKIFNLVLQIGNKNCKKALEEYNNLIISKEQPIVILSMIARQFRIILQCKNMYERGLEIEDINKILSLRNFVVLECIKQSKNFDDKKLILALEDCLNIDIGIKTGKILNEKLALEMLIIKYTS